MSSMEGSTPAFQSCSTIKLSPFNQQKRSASQDMRLNHCPMIQMIHMLRQIKIARNGNETVRRCWLTTIWFEIGARCNVPNVRNRLPVSRSKMWKFITAKIMTWMDFWYAVRRNSFDAFEPWNILLDISIRRNSGIRFSNSSSLCRSIQTVSYTFSCDKCNKNFSDKPALLNHLDGHVSPDQRAFKCNECDYSFVRRYQLSQHQKHRHFSEEKKFVCDTCSKS